MERGEREKISFLSLNGVIFLRCNCTHCNFVPESLSELVIEPEICTLITKKYNFYTKKKFNVENVLSLSVRTAAFLCSLSWTSRVVVTDQCGVGSYYRRPIRTSQAG